jgi:hypothetical protein
VERRVASGQRVQGLLLEMNLIKIKFDLSDRQVTVNPEYLHPLSDIMFFPSAYAAFHG